MTAPSYTAPARTKEGPVTTYRIRMIDGKLTVKAIEEKEGSQATPPPPPSSTWVLGVVGTLSIAGLGLWLLRRS